jgi:hypothetical protein
MGTLTSAAFGVSLTFAALALVAAGLVAREAGAANRTIGWLLSSGMVLAFATFGVIVLRFALLSR